MDEREVLRRASALADQAAQANVLDNQLGQMLTHLKRHNSVESMLSLVKKLPASSFGQRSGQTPRQLSALARLLPQSLAHVSRWEDAAAILGWARRLVRASRQERDDRRPGGHHAPNHP